jgi:hypothetical protein
MTWKLQPQCDGPGCGVVKKEGNQWFEATLTQYNSDPACLDIKIFRMDPAKPTYNHECFCGTPCLLRRIDDKLAKLPGVKE